MDKERLEMFVEATMAVDRICSELGQGMESENWMSTVYGMLTWGKVEADPSGTLGYELITAIFDHPDRFSEEAQAAAKNCAEAIKEIAKGVATRKPDRGAGRAVVPDLRGYWSRG